LGPLRIAALSRTLAKHLLFLVNWAALLRFDYVNILLVDDNRHMRILLSEILRAIGVRKVLEASDGAEGMHILKQFPVDIIMTDLAMAPVDGVDFIRLLRTSPTSPNPMCPVIMISGHSTLRRISEARDAGANEFLSKPVTARGVLSRVSEIIEHPRPFVRSSTYFGPDRRRRQDPSYSGPRRRSHEQALSQVLD
jgi:two-component system chemotaxis response regulator CheY